MGDLSCFLCGSKATVKCSTCGVNCCEKHSVAGRCQSCHYPVVYVPCLNPKCDNDRGIMRSVYEEYTHTIMCYRCGQTYGRSRTIVPEQGVMFPFQEFQKL